MIHLPGAAAGCTRLATTPRATWWRRPAPTCWWRCTAPAAPTGCSCARTRRCWRSGARLGARLSAQPRAAALSAAQHCAAAAPARQPSRPGPTSPAIPAAGPPCRPHQFGSRGWPDLYFPAMSAGMRHRLAWFGLNIEVGLRRAAGGGLARCCAVAHHLQAQPWRAACCRRSQRPIPPTPAPRCARCCAGPFAVAAGRGGGGGAAACR